MKSFSNRFNDSLIKEDLNVSREYDAGEDKKSFDASLDRNTSPEDFDVEGLGEEVYSAVDDTTQQVIKWAEEIDTFTKRLIDPENPDALLTKLTSVTQIPEFATAAESIAKHLRKAVGDIGQAKTELDVLASMATTRRDARKTADTSAAGGSGPY